MNLKDLWQQFLQYNNEELEAERATLGKPNIDFLSPGPIQRRPAIGRRGPSGMPPEYAAYLAAQQQTQQQPAVQAPANLGTAQEPNYMANLLARESRNPAVLPTPEKSLWDRFKNAENNKVFTPARYTGPDSDYNLYSNR